MKIEIKIPVELEDRARKLRDNGGLFGALAHVIDRENEFTLNEIKEKRLNFPKDGPARPDGLRHQTGNLLRAMRRSNGVIISGGVVSSIGANIKYLGVHEFGFDGNVQVRPYLRKREAQKIIFGSKRVVRLGDIPVRAHAMHMKFPERAPIRRGIAARMGSYEGALRKGVINFYEGRGH